MAGPANSLATYEDLLSLPEDARAQVIGGRIITTPATLEAFEFVDGRWTLLGSYDDSATAQIPPFPEIDLVIERLFPRRPGVPERSSHQDYATHLWQPIAWIVTVAPGACRYSVSAPAPEAISARGRVTPLRRHQPHPLSGGSPLPSQPTS